MPAVNGAKIKGLREEAGRSATLFAQQLGISLTYLGDIETGRRKLVRNPGLVKRIADELGVPMSEIRLDKDAVS